jgi:hypothetical protein
MRVSRVDSYRLHARRYYTARASVNAVAYRKRDVCARLDTPPPDTYTFPFAPEGGKAAGQNYSKCRYAGTENFSNAES